MAQDYIVLDKKNENGLIAINKSVFESIAEISISDIDNALPVKGTRFSKPITIRIDHGVLSISADIRFSAASHSALAKPATQGASSVRISKPRRAEVSIELSL